MKIKVLTANCAIYDLLQDAVKIMAKDLVRTRRYVKKFIMMKANIQAVSLKIQTLKSNNSMAQAMKGVTKAMATMNRQVHHHTGSTLEQHMVAFTDL